jgi:hypothetical protein
VEEYELLEIAQLGFALVPAISDGSITLDGTVLKDRGD